MRNLYIRAAGGQSATGSMGIYVRKNGVDTSLNVTIPAGGAGGLFSNTSASVSFAAGDTAVLRFQNNATSGGAPINEIAVVCN